MSTTYIGNFVLDGKNHSYRVGVSKLPLERIKDGRYPSWRNIYYYRNYFQAYVSGAKLTNYAVRVRNGITTHIGFDRTIGRVKDVKLQAGDKIIIYTTKGNYTFTFY